MTERICPLSHKALELSPATFSWAIPNWTALGQKVYSPEFRVGCLTWRLLVFPSGSTVPRTAGGPPEIYLSVYIAAPEKQRLVKSVRRRSSEPSCRCARRAYVRLFPFVPVELRRSFYLDHRPPRQLQVLLSVWPCHIQQRNGGMGIWELHLPH
jgi:hypothetical protein